MGRGWDDANNLLTRRWGRREDTDTPTSVESGQVNMTWSEANRRVARSSSSARRGVEPPVCQSIHIRSLQAGFCGQERRPLHVVG
jgi:hypothetical protein